MKRMALTLAFLVVVGAVGAALFSLPSTFFQPRSTSTSEAAPREAATMAPAMKASAPLTVDAGPAPVPYTPPAPPAQIATLPDPAPPAVVQTPPAPRAPAKPAVERNTAKEERNTAKDVRKDAPCGGKTMKSITVLPDDSVHVQC